MQRTAIIKCPYCNHDEYVVSGDLDKAQLTYMCGKCGKKYQVEFFDYCPTCKTSVGFIESQGFKNDMKLLGKTVLNSIVNPDSLWSTIGGFAQKVLDNGEDANGDGCCPICHQRYYRCSKCSELVSVEHSATFETTIQCPSCGVKLSSRGPVFPSKHSRAFNEDMRMLDSAKNPYSHAGGGSSNDRKRQQNQKPQKQQQVQPCTNIHYSRAELLRIVAECDGNTSSYSENTVMSCNVERLRTNLQRRGINISKTQIGKVSTYKGLVDYIESHTVVENSHNSSSKPTQSNHQTQNQVSKNNDMASNKTNEPIYFSVDKVENIYVVGGSGVQCMTTTSRQGRVNYCFANYTKMVVVNPSGKTVSAVVQSLEHSQYGSYFLPVDPNNSLKKDEFVRVKLKDISASEIEVGSKIYIEEDYNKIPKSDSLESAVDYFSLPFSMPVEDVFSIESRGTIITGKVATGRVHVDDVIYLVKDGAVLSATVKGCEMFRKLLDQAEYGDNVGLLLQGVSPDQVKKGMMATAIRPEASEVSSVLPSTGNDDKDIAKPKDNTPVQKPNQSCPSTEEQEYLEELKECLADGEIGPRERRLLDKLASKLGISPERAADLEASLSAPALTDDEKEYFEEVQAVLADGEISDKERRLLEKLRKMLDISEERAKEIESTIIK